MVHHKPLTKRQQELVRLNKIQDDFISIASHQLRTPASGVKQYLGLLLEGYAGDLTPQQRHYVETAYETNERQLAIINDLLRTAELDSDGYAPQATRIDLVALIQSVIDIYTPLYTTSSQTIVFETNTAHAWINGDTSGLRIVLENLIENAHKYSHEQSAVRVRLDDSPKHVTIQIIDEGVGLDDKSLEIIFQKFTRVDNELSDTTTGSGLGLYIARKTAEAHGGHLTAQANADASGTTFILELPK